MSNPLSIRPISADNVSPIRQSVLWPSIPLSAQLLPFDTLPSTLHFGAFLGDLLVGCLTITLERYQHPERLPRAFSDEGPLHYQLHKFAVLQPYQGKGAGRRLLLESMYLLRQHVNSSDLYSDTSDNRIKRAILLHFDARAAQTGFYEKLGFALLQEGRFVKRGPTGDGPPVEYVKMGKVID